MSNRKKPNVMELLAGSFVGLFDAIRSLPRCLGTIIEPPPTQSFRIVTWRRARRTGRMQSLGLLRISPWLLRRRRGHDVCSIFFIPLDGALGGVNLLNCIVVGVSCARSPKGALPRHISRLGLFTRPEYDLACDFAQLATVSTAPSP